MHTYKVIFASWLVAYVLCFRFKVDLVGNENATGSSTSAQLKSDGGFADLRISHMSNLHPAVGHMLNRTASFHGTSAGPSVLQEAEQIANATANDTAAPSTTPDLTTTALDPTPAPTPAPTPVSPASDLPTSLNDSAGTSGFTELHSSETAVSGSSQQQADTVHTRVGSVQGSTALEINEPSKVDELSNQAGSALNLESEKSWTSQHVGNHSLAGTNSTMPETLCTGRPVLRCEDCFITDNCECDRPMGAVQVDQMAAPQKRVLCEMKAGHGCSDKVGGGSFCQRRWETQTKMEPFVAQARKFLIYNVMQHASQWCNFLRKLYAKEAGAVIHVAADIDGTLAPFPNLGEDRKRDWVKKTEVVMNEAAKLQISVAFATGNPLYMVQERFTLAKSVSGVFSGGADVRLDGKSVNQPNEDWLDGPREHRVWEHTIMAQKQLILDFEKDKKRTPIILWMSAENFIVDDAFLADRLIDRLVEKGGGINVWHDAKSYLSSNLPKSKQDQVVKNNGTYDQLILPLSKYVEKVRASEHGRAQVAYIKGLGKGALEIDKLHKVLDALGIQQDHRKDVERGEAVTLLASSVKATVKLVVTAGHRELVVTRDGVDKAKGLTTLQEKMKSKSNNLVLGLGDSANDVELKNMIEGKEGKSDFPNALYVGTADLKWMQSKLVVNTQDKKFKEESSPLKPEGNVAKVFPGFAYDALDLLVTLVRLAKTPRIKVGKKTLVQFAYDNYWKEGRVASEYYLS